MRVIRFKALEYRLLPDVSFLNERRAKYALEQLWKLVAGEADWDGPPVITFDGVDAATVNKLVGSPGAAVPWRRVAEFAPPGWVNPLDTQELPALFETTGSPAQMHSFPMDLVAATFVLLTRWDEWKAPLPDRFGCQEELASLAGHNGFRHRPVLDEWALVVRAWIKKYRPTWSESLSGYRVEISHDIDILSYYKNSGRVARSMAKALIKDRRGVGATVGALQVGIRALRNPLQDPCVAAFQRLMDFSESRGEEGTFFFMSARPSQYDDGYRLDTPAFSHVLGSIRARGHHCGWHPGYAAAEDDMVFADEYQRITRALDARAIPVRHHFLRWRAGYSWRRLATYGIPYDASLGYNYSSGFRASTCHHYDAYDLENDVALNLKVRPLIAMDGPLQRDSLPVSSNVATLSERCRRVSGNFSIVIHNYSLMSDGRLLADIDDGLREKG